MVDAHGLGPCAVRLGGSNPFIRTKYMVETNEDNGQRPRGNYIFPEDVVEEFLEHALMMEELERDGTEVLEFETHRDAAARLKRRWDPLRNGIHIDERAKPLPREAYLGIARNLVALSRAEVETGSVKGNIRGRAIVSILEEYGA